MAGRRPRPPWPWRDWFFSLLIGVGLALTCIVLVSRGQAPAGSVSAESVKPQRSVGLEFHISFRILLPENKGG